MQTSLLLVFMHHFVAVQHLLNKSLANFNLAIRVIFYRCKAMASLLDDVAPHNNSISTHDPQEINDDDSNEALLEKFTSLLDCKSCLDDKEFNVNATLNQLLLQQHDLQKQDAANQKGRLNFTPLLQALRQKDRQALPSSVVDASSFEHTARTSNDDSLSDSDEDTMDEEEESINSDEEVTEERERKTLEQLIALDDLAKVRTSLCLFKSLRHRQQASILSN